MIQDLVYPLVLPINTQLVDVQPFEGSVAPPTPPQPLGMTAAALNNATPFTVNYRTVSGNVVVRFAGRNAAAVAQNLSATYGGVAMTRVDQPSPSVALNDAWLVAFVIRGASAGAADLVISAAAGSSLVDCIIRIGDISVLPADWQGAVSGYGGAFSYELDDDISPVSPGNNVLASISAWSDARAYPIGLEIDSRDEETEQWNTSFGEMAARFGYLDDAGNNLGLYVFWTNNFSGINMRGGAMFLFELKGATV